MFGNVLPYWVDDLGRELGQAWPLFAAIGLILATVRKWLSAVLRDEVTKIAGVIAEDRKEAEATVVGAVADVQKEFVANGNGSLRSSVDRIEGLVVDLARTTNIAQARILALQSNQGLPLYEMDSNGQITHINSAFAALYDRSHSDLIDGGWIRHLAVRDLNRINRSIIFARDNRSTWFERFAIVQPDGKELEVIGRAYPITCVDGKFLGFSGSITPVHLRRKADQ